jgi:hypothetical protein
VPNKARTKDDHDEWEGLEDKLGKPDLSFCDSYRTISPCRSGL